MGLFWASQVAQQKRICLPIQKMQVLSLGQKESLEEETTAHSSILAWRIPWTKEPGASVHGSQKSQTESKETTHTIIAGIRAHPTGALTLIGFNWGCRLLQRRQWHPTPVLLPGNSYGWRSLVGCSPWGR